MMSFARFQSVLRQPTSTYSGGGSKPFVKIRSGGICTCKCTVNAAAFVPSFVDSEFAGTVKL
jgi:hypothetical protein